MKNVVYFFAPLFFLVFLSCKLEPDDDNDSDDASYDHSQKVGELSDTKLDTIKEFLLANTYSTWTATEIKEKSLNSPHGTVRTFFNETIEASIQADAEVHPEGSITVKELYESDSETLKGYAADIKIKEGAGGDTWLFFEGFLPDLDHEYAIGPSGCTGCHSSGTDFVRESLP